MRKSPIRLQSDSHVQQDITPFGWLDAYVRKNRCDHDPYFMDAFIAFRNALKTPPAIVSFIHKHFVDLDPQDPRAGLSKNQWLLFTAGLAFQVLPHPPLLTNEHQSFFERTSFLGDALGFHILRMNSYSMAHELLLLRDELGEPDFGNKIGDFDRFELMVCKKSVRMPHFFNRGSTKRTNNFGYRPEYSFYGTVIPIVNALPDNMGQYRREVVRRTHDVFGHESSLSRLVGMLWLYTRRVLAQDDSLGAWNCAAAHMLQQDHPENIEWPKNGDMGNQNPKFFLSTLQDWCSPRIMEEALRLVGMHVIRDHKYWERLVAVMEDSDGAYIAPKSRSLKRRKYGLFPFTPVSQNVSSICFPQDLRDTLFSTPLPQILKSAASEVTDAALPVITHEMLGELFFERENDRVVQEACESVAGSPEALAQFMWCVARFNRPVPGGIEQLKGIISNLEGDKIFQDLTQDKGEDVSSRIVALLNRVAQDEFMGDGHVSLANKLVAAVHKWAGISPSDTRIHEVPDWLQDMNRIAESFYTARSHDISRNGLYRALGFMLAAEYFAPAEFATFAGVFESPLKEIDPRAALWVTAHPPIEVEHVVAALKAVNEALRGTRRPEHMDNVLEGFGAFSRMRKSFYEQASRYALEGVAHIPVSTRPVTGPSLHGGV